MLNKIKKLFNKLFSSTCFMRSSCCSNIDADIEVDLDGDKTPDVNIHIDGEGIEIKKL